MKKQNKEIATIKLIAPKGETMIWKTSINHIYKNKVKDLEIAKANFAHYLVNKYWLQNGEAIKVLLDEEDFIIRPIAKDRDELFKKKALMRKEIDLLKKDIIAKRIIYVPKDKGYHYSYKD